jgi:Zn finger protein HypA/HybF involved in hydrogenase expression
MLDCSENQCNYCFATLKEDGTCPKADIPVHHENGVDSSKHVCKAEWAAHNHRAATGYDCPVCGHHVEDGGDCDRCGAPLSELIRYDASFVALSDEPEIVWSVKPGADPDVLIRLEQAKEKENDMSEERNEDNRTPPVPPEDSLEKQIQDLENTIWDAGEDGEYELVDKLKLELEQLREKITCPDCKGAGDPTNPDGGRCGPCHHQWAADDDSKM